MCFKRLLDREYVRGIVRHVSDGHDARLEVRRTTDCFRFSQPMTWHTNLAAASVSTLIGSIGSDRFYISLSRFLTGVVPETSVEILRYFREREPEQLCTNISTSFRSIAGDAYFRTYFRCDPFYRQYLRGGPTGLYDLDDVRCEHPSPEYFHEFYRHTGFAKELNGLVLRDDGSAVVVILALLRSGGLAECSDAISRMKDCWLVVEPAISKHTELEDVDRNAAVETARACFRRAKKVFGSSVLAHREQQVVQLLLSGYSVAGVAAKMGISCGTAKNYCKSIYRKLDVGSKGQLFSLFFEAGLIHGQFGDDDPLRTYDSVPEPSMCSRATAAIACAARRTPILPSRRGVRSIAKAPAEPVSIDHTL
jgi:DNA-binding CsgD family transcriptional regulator